MPNILAFRAGGRNVFLMGSEYPSIWWQISGNQGWIATACGFAQRSEDKRKLLIYNGVGFILNTILGMDTPFGT